MSPITSYVASAAYLANDRVDDAVLEGQRTLSARPELLLSGFGSCRWVSREGQFPEAIALLHKSQEATHFPSSGLAITYARMGREIEARNILAQLFKQERNDTSQHL